MATKLLDAVADNTVGTRQKVLGPCTVFTEGNLGGGTVTINASRDVAGTLVAVTTVTAAGVTNVNIIGPCYLQATLAGATTPSLSVVVN